MEEGNAISSLIIDITKYKYRGRPSSLDAGAAYERTGYYNESYACESESSTAFAYALSIAICRMYSPRENVLHPHHHDHPHDDHHVCPDRTFCPAMKSWSRPNAGISQLRLTAWATSSALHFFYFDICLAQMEMGAVSWTITSSVEPAPLGGATPEVCLSIT